MNLEYKELLPQHFSRKSKVWVYQSSKLFSLSEALEIETLLNQFVTEWRSHGDKVEGYANLFFGQFIVLMADETSTTVGGCSTDASMRFIKELEQKFSVDFFNRTSLAFLIKDKIERLPMNQIQYAFENGFITESTLYFNNMVTTKEELEKEWIVPLSNSWLAKQLLTRTS